MATEAAGIPFGYDYKFIEEPPDDLKCLICLCVARDPQQHGDGGCGKIFCSNCLKKYKRDNRNCPQCRRNIVTFKDVRSERDIQSLKVKCVNEQGGCQWSGELRSLEDHLKACEYTMVLCPNECTYVETKTKKEKIVTILHKNLSTHLEQCPRREYTCPHCEEIGEYEHIIGEHLDYCPKVEIECLNAPDCQQTISRNDVLKHLDMCPYQTVSCMYKDFGCKEERQRRDIKKHEDDDKAHLRITMKTVLKQRQEIAELKTKVQAICKQQRSLLPPMAYLRIAHMLRLTCKLTKFTQKKENNEEFFSNPFYTHPNGYKMILCVTANGDNEYEGTHVSVWIYLMRGEYDDQLEFPFKGTITFELLNQLEDNNHHSKSYTFDGTEDFSQRVLQCNIANIAGGIADFISHEALDRNNVIFTWYLNDNCLVFRISACMQSYKPWLQCTN